MLRTLTFFACLATITLTSGCGGGEASDAPEIHPVKGTLTVGGEPGAGIIVTLMSTDTKIFPATATVAEDGSFTLVSGPNGEGAQAGDYSVVLSFTPDENSYGAAGGGPPKAPFPKEWTDAATSPQKVTVPEGGITDLKIEVPKS
jgi:hypothetical protein